jgi:hypothetical protein
MEVSMDGLRNHLLRSYNSLVSKLNRRIDGDDIVDLEIYDIEKELEGITTTILGKTVTRADLESQIEVNSGKIAEHKRIELNRQVEIGKNALIAAKASATQLANGKAIASLPGANGSGSGSGGTGTNPTPTKPTPAKVTPQATAAQISKLQSAASVTGLTDAKTKADKALTSATDTAAYTYKINKSMLASAVASGNIQSIYGKINVNQREAFTADFNKLVGLKKTANDYVSAAGGDITTSTAGKAAVQALLDALPQETKDKINLLKNRYWDYQNDLPDYLEKQKAYKDAAKKLGLENVAWKDISPDNQAKLKTVYDAYNEKVQYMFNRHKQTNDAIDELKVNEVYYRQFGLAPYQFIKTDISGKEVRKWGQYASGGMVVPKGYARGGGIYGTDTVPAMLTPGEFVIRKSAVDQIGSKKLNAINSGNSGSESVYNYSITVNATSSDASDIADAVLRQIKRVDSQRLRSNVI